MKRIIDKYLGWLKDSNHPKHILCGLLLYAAMMAVCLIMGNTFASSAIISLVATIIAAMAVDYKNKLWGGKFDWLDVAATVLLPGMITSLVVLIYIF